MPVFTLGDKHPQIAPGAWIAPNAAVIGDIRLGNTVMLGAIADHLPFGAGVLLDCVLKRFERKGAALVELNRRAFEAGRAAVGEAEAALA